MLRGGGGRSAACDRRLKKHLPKPAVVTRVPACGCVCVSRWLWFNLVSTHKSSGCVVVTSYLGQIWITTCWALNEHQSSVVDLNSQSDGSRPQTLFLSPLCFQFFSVYSEPASVRLYVLDVVGLGSRSRSDQICVDLLQRQLVFCGEFKEKPKMRQSE